MAMKRVMILIIALIFTVGTVMTAPASFADKIDKTNFKGKIAKEKSEDKQKKSKKDDDDYEIIDGKDTSWFDHENPKDSYKISTEAQLRGLCSLINEEQIYRWKPTRLETFEGVTFTLTKDIKLKGEWTPIGHDDAAYFAGVFDGDGHTISNMKIDNTVGNTGFFGYLKGEVRNLTVEGVNNSNDSNSGGLVGTLDPAGRVVDCTSNVKVNGKDKTGGIVGYNPGGTVELCVNLGDVSGTYKVGGVVGENWGGTVKKSGNRGVVKSTKRGVATYGTGGVAGRSLSPEAEVSECYNTGEIKSNTEATGGVVGYMNATGSTVKDSFNIGTININIKDSEKQISKAYVGGVVGIAGINSVSIKNCYNAGTINNADVSGGVIGKYLNDTDIPVEERFIKNNYFVSKGFSAGCGELEKENDPNLDKAFHGVSDASMHNIASSLSVSFMKESGAYGNNGYPVLRWQEPVGILEKTKVEGVDEKIQKKLDKYIVDNAAKQQPGEAVINILYPGAMSSDAFILYMEAHDKIEQAKEDLRERNEK